MDPNEVPTKGNLMRARNSLKLARQGYDLMDKKRNILIRELTAYTEEAREIQEVINETYRKAYASLQKANMQMGIENVQTLEASWARKFRWYAMTRSRTSGRLTRSSGRAIHWTRRGLHLPASRI